MKTHQGHAETARLLSRREVLKLLGWGAGALASTSLLPGCGPAAPAEEVEAPAPSEPIVLRYQNHWSKETDAHYEGMNWLYKEFPAQYPDITIENVLNPDSQESHKKILADCAAGDCPDVIHGPEPSM